MAERTAINDTIARNMIDASRLVLVPAHAIYIGRRPSESSDPKYWIGRFPSEAPYYIEHIRQGILETAKEYNNSLLVFSGGQTNIKAGPFSEAQGYWYLARDIGWSPNSEVENRATTEERAHDSFENLLFGYGRFFEKTGMRPKEIVICGWKFKEERYRLHAEALGLRQEMIHYVGVNNPEGEVSSEKTTVDLFRKYPLGDEGLLMQKRIDRDPNVRGDNAYAHYAIYDLFEIFRLMRKEWVKNEIW